MPEWMSRAYRSMNEHHVAMRRHLVLAEEHTQAISSIHTAIVQTTQKMGSNLKKKSSTRSEDKIYTSWEEDIKLMNEKFKLIQNQNPSMICTHTREEQFLSDVDRNENIVPTRIDHDLITLEQKAKTANVCTTKKAQLFKSPLQKVNEQWKKERSMYAPNSTPSTPIFKPNNPHLNLPPIQSLTKKTNPPPPSTLPHAKPTPLPSPSPIVKLTSHIPKSFLERQEYPKHIELKTAKKMTASEFNKEVTKAATKMKKSKKHGESQQEYNERILKNTAKSLKDDRLTAQVVVLLDKEPNLSTQRSIKEYLKKKNDAPAPSTSQDTNIEPATVLPEATPSPATTEATPSPATTETTTPATTETTTPATTETTTPETTETTTPATTETTTPATTETTTRATTETTTPETTETTTPPTTETTTPATIETTTRATTETTTPETTETTTPATTEITSSQEHHNTTATPPTTEKENEPTKDSTKNQSTPPEPSTSSTTPTPTQEYNDIEDDAVIDESPSDKKKRKTKDDTNTKENKSHKRKHKHHRSKERSSKKHKKSVQNDDSEGHQTKQQRQKQKHKKALQEHNTESASSEEEHEANQQDEKHKRTHRKKNQTKNKEKKKTSTQIDTPNAEEPTQKTKTVIHMSDIQKQAFTKLTNQTRATFYIHRTLTPDLNTALELCRKKVDTPTGPTYKCQNCDFEAQQNWDIKRHILRKHMQYKEYQCSFVNCEFVASHCGTVQRHYTYTHLPNIGPNFFD